MKGAKKADVGKGKKPYLKPEVQQVQLKPEEAVLGGCKTSSAAGPARVTCDAGVGICRALGTS
jgi:hypothetical protein